jgi:CRISPR-associated protein Csd1
MSWINKLHETYENCGAMIGKIGNEKEVPLLPICHTTQKAQIEVVIDQDGDFKRARVVPKDEARTIIPCTESSGGRAGSRPVCHPLCDKLQYLAGDFIQYGGEVTSGYADDPHEPFRKYCELLSNWCNSRVPHPKALAVLKYIHKKQVVNNLVAYKVLVTDDDGKLSKKPEKRSKNDPDIFNVVDNQSDAFIRWEVETPGKPGSKAWDDSTLWESWTNYYSATRQTKALCYVIGRELLVAEQHPAKLRNDGDKAKLISSNDWSGFTFRGRFTDTKEHNTYQTCSVAFEVTQKAHSALRWLISRQGYRNGGQAIVAWATSGANIPKPFDDALAILGQENLESDDADNASTAQNFAIKLRNKIAGYKADLGDTSGVVVMGLDSATPGRLAITFYRELTGSEFLERLEKWHETCAWFHDYRFVEEKVNKKTRRKHLRFVGAPAPRDIAEAAYGSSVDGKLKKSTVERLLPCIIDGRQIPRDIVDSAVRRARNRAGMEAWEWNKTLSIACALYRKLNEKEGYSMALDEERKTRDYLYGRLLALADSLEQWALNKTGENRQTNAARLMQRFADRPYNTWRTIELSLAPYKARLGGQSQKRQELISKVHAMFDPLEDYTSDRPLSGEFLLGYHCQREALRPKGSVNTNESEQEIAAETAE